MGKNNQLINSLNKIAKRNRDQNVMYASEQVIPQIYAAFAIALHRKHGFGYQRISELFAATQEIWTEFSGRGKEMIALCEKETGITVVSSNPESPYAKISEEERNEEK